VKIRTSGYQTLECFIATFHAIALPRPPSRYKGRGEGSGRKGFGIGRRRKGTERKDVKG